jgi:hypothetical protein
MSLTTVLNVTRKQAVPAILEAILGVCDDRLLADMGLERDAGNRLVPAPQDQVAITAFRKAA